MSDEAKKLQGMPHAVMAEKCVLSMLMRDPGLLDEGPPLTTEYFYLPGHRRIFDRIHEDHLRGNPFELVRFVQGLVSRHELAAVGGPGAVSDLYTYETAGSLGKLKRMHALLRVDMARRMAIRIAREIEETAYTESEPDELLALSSEPITTLHDLLTDTRPARDTRALLQDCAERFRALCMGETQPMGVSTSLAEINRYFHGLVAKRTIVISGYPGGGKTALAGQLAMDAALGGHNTLVCSLEMPEETMMMRNIAYAANVPGALLTDPRGYCREKYDCDTPPKHVLRGIKEATLRIAASPYAIEDLTGANVRQIVSCIRRAHRRKPLEVVVVDFVQRIRPLPEMRRESQEQQIAHASHLLTDLCKELGFTLLLGSQLNKEGAAKYAEAINEDADLHLQIVQDRGGKGKTCTMEHLGIAVVKDRHHGQDGALLALELSKPMLRFIPKVPKT